MSISQDILYFGKYKDQNISSALKDIKYCKWLLKQDWFKINYEYLYNVVDDWIKRSNECLFISHIHKPQIELEETKIFHFIDEYKYFNLLPLETLEIELTKEEKICYIFYITLINELKDKIIKNKDELNQNIYDIKAPVKWLKRFETECNLPREKFKEFLSSYSLPNIPYIIEDIKKEGGIEYQGANSYKIGKKRSEEQENWWGEILKKSYGEDLSTQFKYENCFFDFLNISINTIFECKLGLKDFNEEQYKKYLIALKEFRIIYLIDRDCVINIKEQIVYTTDQLKYKIYKLKTKKSKLGEIIENFDIIQIENFDTLFGNIKLI